jgi:site-specific DNA recombinase
LGNRPGVLKLQDAAFAGRFDAVLVTEAGGKPRYLLSGLLRCDVCDAHYTITNAISYGCSSYHDGHACSNSVLLRRDRAEEALLGPIRDVLLKPDRVPRMAKEMQDYFADSMRHVQAQANQFPRELQELAARITRLRDRLKNGDPDMTADELQAAIDRAEAKHRGLEDQGLGATVSISKALAVMPRAAELYRRQVAQGLDGKNQQRRKRAYS